MEKERKKEKHMGDWEREKSTCVHGRLGDRSACLHAGQ